MKCYMDTDSFFCHVKTDDIYKDIVWDFETRFDTSNFEIGRLLAKIKSNWTNETWSRWENHKTIFRIKSKNIELFKREQFRR